MTIFVTNIWNHYTTNIGSQMAAVLGVDNFRMVLTAPVQEEPEFKARMAMGWKFDLPSEKWLVPNPQYAGEFAGSEHVRLLAEADVAIVGALNGARPLRNALKNRIVRGKLTFFVGERIFKKYPSFWDAFNVRQLVRWFRWHRLYSHENVHYLSISHWGCEDVRFLDGCHRRMWKWAYTPEVSASPVAKKQNAVMRIGWCGRMIPWKHVEYMVDAMAMLPKDYLSRCKMTLVGEGECKGGLEKLVAAKGLDENVEFLPYMPVADVMKLMEELDVYILPSDRGEGWGVVLAEAMDKCCVPISCVEAGATLDLIDDGENGFVFEKGDCRRIAKKLMWLMDHPDERWEMALRAWKTMQAQSPERAAQRLCGLIRAIQARDMSLIPDEGLCSPCRI